MPSPIGASGGASAASGLTIDPPLQMKKVQEGSLLEATRLADRLAAQSAAPPPSGRGQIVDTFA